MIGINRIINIERKIKKEKELALRLQNNFKKQNDLGREI